MSQAGAFLTKIGTLSPLGDGHMCTKGLLVAQNERSKSVNTACPDACNNTFSGCDPGNFFVRKG
jgi:hypothetical protein